MESLNADLFQLILVVSLVPLLGFLFALMSGEITWPKKSFYIEDECRDGVNIRWEADAFFILNDYEHVLGEILWEASIQKATCLTPISVEDAMDVGEGFIQTALQELDYLPKKLQKKLEELNEKSLKLCPAIYKIDEYDESTV